MNPEAKVSGAFGVPAHSLGIFVWLCHTSLLLETYAILHSESCANDV